MQAGWGGRQAHELALGCSCEWAGVFPADVLRPPPPAQSRQPPPNVPGQFGQCSLASAGLSSQPTAAAVEKLEQVLAGRLRDNRLTMSEEEQGRASTPPQPRHPALGLSPERLLP